MKQLYYFLLAVSFALVVSSCNNEPKQTGNTAVEKPKVLVPSFNKDSAYYYIEKQLSFGPRVPGTETHIECRDWMVEKFTEFGAEVIVQDFTAQFYTGETASSSNIIAQFNPAHENRVILSAHWDSRFIGEEDEDKDKKDQPIPGADDGGSGVGVLMEIARQIGQNPIDLGVDIILWDAEDQGQRGGGQQSELTWCLGSQYWSRNKHTNKYKAMYGINLDMVGAKNPRFGKDGVSRYYAPKVLNKVWKLARTMGYSDMFADDNTGGITDDHKIVNEMAGIPMINIINQPIDSDHSFVRHWHTHNDNIDAIEKRTLKAVGQVVLAVVYKESDGTIKSFE